MNAILQIHELRAVLRSAELAHLTKPVYLAHLLCAYSAARIANVVHARWEDMNLDSDPAIWIIPRSQMKVRTRSTDHRIPLTGKLVDELRRWHAVFGDQGWCFPSTGGSQHVTREAVEKVYRVTLGLGGRHSPHGWRSAFSTLTREHGFDREVVELALDHVHDDEVAMSYDRGERFDQRIKLYAWWSEQLDGLATESDDTSRG